MIGYLLRRALMAVPLLFVVSTVVFLLVHLIPGDPVDFMIGENAALADKRELRRAYHLDKPILLSLRPFFDREDAEGLLRRSGAEPDASSEAGAAWQELMDTGHWALGPLREVAADSGAPKALRSGAARALGELVDSGVVDSTGELGPGGRVAAVFTETQYARFFSDLLRGELRSLHTRQPVASTLRSRFGHTMLLAGCALLVATLLAIPIGALAASRQYSWVDNVSMVAALAGISMPNFWLGPLLIIAFAIELGWFPVSGAREPASIVLPAVTLGLGMSAILTRITRASVLDTVRQDYVRTARAKGLSERAVLVRHALRTALIPVVTVLGLQFGALLAGSIITEEIFGWPGLGREVIGAIRARDFPMIQGCVLLIATTYVAVNTATDILYTRINPRVRLE